MKQAAGNVWNVVSGIIAQLGNRTATAPMVINQDAVYITESEISIQPKVMAGATFLLLIVLIVVSRK